MDKESVIKFFDEKAPVWDKISYPNEKVLERILGTLGSLEGYSILDVGCGTGVLFPYLLKRGAVHVTGIDISPEMAERAKQKYKEEARVDVLNIDAEAGNIPGTYDLVIIYNALPHFCDIRVLCENLAANLKEECRLAVIHDMPKSELDKLHKSIPSEAAMLLPETGELEKTVKGIFEAEIQISDEYMYEFVGRKCRRAKGIQYG